MTDSSPHPERWAQLDPRSLAFFRILLGVTLLVDLLGRSRDLSLFYTDQGLLSRELALQSGFAREWLCFHLGTGSFSGIACLFALQASLAIGLLLGWRTRWMLFGSWLLLNSLHVRNPFVNDRGDLELVLLLFWGFFLPLEQRWSRDSRTEQRSTWSSQGLGPAAYLVQLSLIYLLAGLTKYGEFWLVRGDGLLHSLQSPLFATALAGQLAQAPSALLWFGNYAVIAGELFVGFLLLCPYNAPLLRSLALTLIILFHLSVAALFQLGLFPWIGIVGAVALLPKSFWESRAGRFLESHLNILAGDRSLKDRVLPKALQGFLALSLILVLLSNACNRVDGEAFSRGPLLTGLTRSLRLEQHWELFSPIPPYKGVFQLRATSSERPLLESPGATDSAHPFRNHRWRMLMIAALYPRFAVIRPGLVTSLLPADAPPDDYSLEFHVRLVDSSGKSKQITKWTLWKGRTSRQDFPHLIDSAEPHVK